VIIGGWEPRKDEVLEPCYITRNFMIYTEPLLLLAQWNVEARNGCAHIYAYRRGERENAYRILMGKPLGRSTQI
jgi:hypothetical protein